MAHFPGPGFASSVRIGADPDQYHGGKKCGSSVSQTLQFVIKYMLLFYRYSKKGGIGNSSDTVQCTSVQLVQKRTHFYNSKPVLEKF